MKKLILLLVLAVMLIVGSLVGLAQAESSVCPECDLYTHAGTVPYIVPADGGWWTGLAITNTGYETVICRFDYVGDSQVKRVDIPPKSVVTLMADVEKVSYAKVRSAVPLYISVMIGDGEMLQGYNFELQEIPDDE